MERYSYETPDSPGALFRIFDAKRGSVGSYEKPSARAVALCRDRDDAETVTAALNAFVKNGA